MVEPGAITAGGIVLDVVAGGRDCKDNRIIKVSHSGAIEKVSGKYFDKAKFPRSQYKILALGDVPSL